MSRSLLSSRLLHRSAALSALVTTGCVLDPAEFLAVQMAVQDGYDARGVLEQARPSRPLTVAIRMGNFGQETVHIEVPCPPFRVTNRRGEQVGPGPTACAENVPSTVELSPGETFSVTAVWAGESSTSEALPTAAYGLEGWTRRVDRTYPVRTGVEWVCLVPDSTPPPNFRYHDCGLPGDLKPSRNLPSAALLQWTEERAAR